jgi:HD-GYP domain-containing protein (c-di-GMP phosphodiesterase class II)
MRKILLSDVKPGMTLAKNIYSDDGRILLAGGITLQAIYLEKLKALDILAIYIKDDLLTAVEIPEIISEKTRQMAIANVKEAFHQLSFKGRIDLRKVTKSVNDIIDELLANPKVLVNLTDIRSHDNYTFAHCASVCVLSVLTGINLGLNQLQLKELGIGAILHDIGKIAVDKNILNKPAKLTDEEFTVIKEHSTSGFELIRKIEGISILSAHVPFQHHEKLDGSGYPRGLKGKDIHLYAKIVAVADVYDALMADRVYRHAFSSHEASEVIAHGANVYFDKSVTKAFLKNIAIFPIGSLVKLNTGEIAVVVDVNRELYTRPIVKILSDIDRLALGKGTELDLCKYPTVIIEKVIKPEDSEYFQV